MTPLEKLNSMKMPFAELKGVKFTEADKDRVVARMLVRPDLCTLHHTIHGGAVMAFADNLGGTAATANLPAAGGSTATIESKTNFFAGIPEGDVARAECTPLHRGRTTTVWQTKITRGDGKLAAVVAAAGE